jgi:hypothetical protein
MRRRSAIAGLLLLLVCCGILGSNYVMVGYPLARDIQTDSRNTGVFRVFLQFAAAIKDRHFARVELAHRGTTKFVISGDYFAQLGAEYGQQNPMSPFERFPSIFTSLTEKRPTARGPVEYLVC